MKTQKLVLVLALLVTSGKGGRPSIASGDAPETGASTSVSMAVRQVGNDEGTILFQEYFDDADFASRGWYDNTNLQLSTTEHITGSTSSVEFHFHQGATTPTSGGAIRRKFPETDEIYASYHVKYSSNWEGSNRSYHPHEFLILTNLDGDWIGPAYTHMTAYIEQNEGEPLLAIQDGQNIDESNIQRGTRQHPLLDRHGEDDAQRYLCVPAFCAERALMAPGTNGSANAWSSSAIHVRRN